MPSYPDRILSEVLWSCGRKRYDRAAFDAAVTEYHMDVLGTAERWKPEESVFPGTSVRIGFMCWDAAGEEQLDVAFDIESDHPEHFTAGDLLFKVCDGIAADLEEHDRKLYDHCFFEGLSLHTPTAERDRPLYFVRFGS